jgi:hypothetical protein
VPAVPLLVLALLGALTWLLGARAASRVAGVRWTHAGRTMPRSRM